MSTFASSSQPIAHPKAQVGALAPGARSVTTYCWFVYPFTLPGNSSSTPILATQYEASYAYNQKAMSCCESVSKSRCVISSTADQDSAIPPH